jgi:hypothetical protein
MQKKVELLLAIKKFPKGPHINATISAFFGFEELLPCCRKIFAAWLSLGYFQKSYHLKEIQDLCTAPKQKDLINNHLFQFIPRFWISVK